MSEYKQAVQRKQYSILNAAYYHGNNVKTVLDIGLRVVLFIAIVVGTVKLALA